MYRGEVSNWSCSWPITALDAGQETAGKTREEDDDIRAPCDRRKTMSDRHTPESKPETFCLVCFIVIIPPGLETHYPACFQRLLHTWWSPRCSSEDREEKQWVINILDHREQRETVRDGFNLQSNTADLWGRLPLVLQVLTKLNKEIPKLKEFW